MIGTKDTSKDGFQTAMVRAMRKGMGLGLLIGWVALGLGCDGTDVSPGGRVDIRGTITSLWQADAQAVQEGILGVILIEGLLEQDTAFDKASVTVTASTRIFRREGETLRAATFASLAVGQRVEASFTGPVMESYPVQATASEIVILE